MTVNLRGDSINGPILGTTIPTSLDPFFSDYRNFSFPNRIKMSPGTKYFLEPVVISGTGVFAGVTYLQYPGGDAIYNGAVFSDRDFMFREGIIVPEPSFSVLFAIGMSALMWKLLIATRLKR
jgi:hypothetical protein